jgi:hypothetical protein
MLHMFHTNIARVCSKCFIYFRLLQQVFFFGVASVFMFQALNGTVRVTHRISAGGGASAIRSRCRSGEEACSPCVRAGDAGRARHPDDTGAGNEGGAENGDACDTGCRRGRPSASISVFIAKWTICLNPSVAIYNSTKHIGRSDKPT